MKNTRMRLQKGSITLRGGRWFTRYYEGQGPNRRMVSRFLAVKDGLHHSKSCAPLRKLNQSHMAKVNAEAGRRDDRPGDVAVRVFFGSVYMPWVEANEKPSTQLSYSQIWRQHLLAHFDGHTLESYRTSDASRFLTGLADSGLGRNAIGHVRSLMSGIMSHAVNLGLISVNVLREAKVLSKMRPPAKAECYSLREVEDMVSALAHRPDAQLLVCLCGFMGLRPSEASGLAWDSVDLGQGLIHLRRGVVRGVVGDLKTEGSAQTLPLIEPVRSLLESQSKHARTWVFENSAGHPRDLKNLADRVIRPAVQRWNSTHEEKIIWRGLYALRRSAASFLWSLTETPRHRSSCSGTRAQGRLSGTT